MNRNQMAKAMLEAVRDKRMDKATAISLIRQLTTRNDVAVIGMGLRLPGMEDTKSFWTLLREGRSTVTRSTKHRLNLVRDAFPASMVKDVSDYSKGGYFDQLDYFDASCFGLSEQEAAELNPSHRILLETAYHALEDAGLLGEKNSGNSTPIFIGNNFTKDMLFSYSSLILSYRRNYQFASMLANWSSGLATRLSSYFDMKGESYTLDGSCSSSTMAIINACDAIRSGRTTTAIAGGILIDFSPLKTFNNTGWIFAHDDTVVPRSYDRHPQGAYIGEGAGVVVLKRLDRALEDGDQIHAVIRGYGQSNNGSNGEFTRSSIEDIKRVVLQAVKDAELNVDDVAFLIGEGYIDRTEEGLELAGVSSGFRQFTDRVQYCGLGSITDNLGYLQSAIGVFQLIAMTMALKNKELPPVPHFVEPTDFVHLGRTPFYVNDRVHPWEIAEGKKRLGALFQYGFGGNNSLLFLEEAPDTGRRQDDKQVGRRELFTLSAATDNALQRLVEEILLALDTDVRPTLENICYTVNVGRRHHAACRLALLCSSVDELVHKLRRFLRDKSHSDGFYYQNQRQSQTIRKESRLRKSTEGLSLQDVAKQYSEGTNFRLKELYAERACHQVDLPLYPFDRKPYWIQKVKISFVEGLKYLLK